MSENEQQKEKLEGMCPHGNFPESCNLCKSEKDITKKEKGEQSLVEEISREKQEQKLEKESGIKDTAAFRLAPLQAKKEWLQYVIDNKHWLTKYHDTWDNWLKDRKQEISQQELFDLFEVKKTADLRKLLQNGEIDKFKECMNYITENRDRFPQYNDDWFKDRKKELEQAQK